MGEQALDAWMRRHGSSFEHNDQSLRVVTLLEEHSNQYLGLNLNREVLDGLQKHRSKELGMEAQLVNLADEIAYSAHDCDDGLRAGLFTRDEVSAVPLVGRASAQTQLRGTSLRGALIDLLVHDLYAVSSSIIAFSTQMRSQLAELQAFLHGKMYAHPRVREANQEGQKIITTLCDRLFTQPTEKVVSLQKRTGGALSDAVKDYVAGMTDAFAKGML